MVLDIGSRTHRALWHAGTLVREARVGRANVENVTPEDAGRIVDRAASELTALVLDVVAVTGSAGPVMFKGGMAVHQMELQDRLRALLDAEDVPDVVFPDGDPVTGGALPARTVPRTYAAARYHGGVSAARPPWASHGYTQNFDSLN